MAEDEFDKAFEGHDDDDDAEEAAEDAEFESEEDEDDEDGEVDPNDEDFSEEWSEVPLPKKEEPGEGTRKIMRFVGPVIVVLVIVGAAAGIYFSGVIGMAMEFFEDDGTEEVAKEETDEPKDEEKNPFSEKEEAKEELPAEPEEVDAYEETVKVMVRMRKPAELWLNGVKQGRKRAKKAQLVLTPGEHTFRVVGKRGGLEMVLDIPPGPTVTVEADIAKGILGIKEAKAKGKKGKKRRGKRKGR